MPTTQEDFDALTTLLKKNNAEEVKKMLDDENFDVTATDSDGRSCLMCCCQFSSSLEIIKRVFERIDKLGGKNLLSRQLAATENHSRTCLMLCFTFSSSPEVMKVVFEKIIEAGGNDFLLSQLTASHKYGFTCLMVGCGFSKSPEVMKVVFEKIDEVGGTTLLKSQLTTTDNDGFTCLKHACRYSSSPEVMQLLLKKIFEVGGGPALLKSQLKSSATDVLTLSCLECCCGNSSGEVIKLVAMFLFCFDFFQEQFAKLHPTDYKDLNEKTNIDSSTWTPLSEPATMKLLFSVIKRVGGDQFLKEFLTTENEAGETPMLSVCLHHNGDRERLEIIMDTIEEVGGEEFLAEQISNKRQSDGMTCFYALCQFAAKYDTLSLFVSKIFESEFVGRRHLKDLEFKANQCLESVLSRPLESQDDKKFLSLMVSLYSITGLFEEQYSRLNEEKMNPRRRSDIWKEKLRRICGITSGEWRRDSTMCDLIGEIKKSIMKK